MSEKSSKTIRWPLYTAIALLIVAGIAIFAWNGGRPKALCSEEVAANLIAPDTLEILSFDPASIGDSEEYRVEYRALNGYGVPLRGRGRCVLSDDRGVVVWYPEPEF
ncbi:MAG: hypothetical protein GW855_07710 [Erythrobacter sp.]|nr:hypothetical protein [Erythrobacter sp.]NCQ62423.1 hypothetical protein [Alphaproteobacteria bacterium]